jgi:tRNA(Ile)-lysidine synthetase-like protein
VMLPAGWHFRREYQFAVLERGASPKLIDTTFKVTLDLHGTTTIDTAGFVFEGRIELSDEAQSEERWWLPAKSMEAVFDADQLSTALSVRNFAPGDRIALLGMRGTRKVQDLFVDRKLARRRRSRWPLVVADDEILWIPAIARSRLALVTSATKRTQHFRASITTLHTTIDVAPKSIGVLNYPL